MLPKPERAEINYHTSRLIVGIIALTLATITSLLTKNPLNSISAAYWEPGPSHVVFIGFLFAIAAFLLAYNGHNTLDMILARIAAIAAVGVAWFPCNCGPNSELGAQTLHLLSAGAMFLVLAYFAYGFFQEASKKRRNPKPEDGRPTPRAAIYGICALAILVAIAAFVLPIVIRVPTSDIFPNYVFVWEAVALHAFGAAWLVASRRVPGLN